MDYMLKLNTSIIKQIYWTAIPLILSTSLSNVLEIVDLAVSSYVDIEIIKSISFLERFRFVFGAILIAFTSVLSMYLNRYLAKNKFKEANEIYSFISELVNYLGLFFGLIFLIGINYFAQKGNSTWIYGLGTGINIYLMYLSTPCYIVLVSFKKTDKIFKFSLFVTIFNSFFTWFLAKKMDMGTLGIISPTVVATFINLLLLKNEVSKIGFLPKESKISINRNEILINSFHNMKGNLAVCLTDLFLVIVSIKLGEVGVFYGLFFALEKFLMGITHGVANIAGVHFAQTLESSENRPNLSDFFLVCVFNALFVSIFSIISFNFYGPLMNINVYLIPIVITVFLRSINVFLSKSVLRQAGDLIWIKNFNVWMNSFSKIIIAFILITIIHTSTTVFFWLLSLQALLMTILILNRLSSKSWIHEL